ncbi:MAG: 50S ribosomal protein L9 [Anaerolineales bacterium]|nr:50S ribosomal protein L9 [Anaerolineales bacterium]
MKVLLLKDVYNLGRAGDVKKVADGYGRNYLLPQGFAVIATPGALKQADRIRISAEADRIRLNQELGSVAEKLDGMKIAFGVKAGETGRLYGSITTAMLADKINEEAGTSLSKRQIDSQPVKTLGVQTARIRLTMDLVPEVTIIVHREGESPESAFDVEEAEVDVEEAFNDLQDQLDEEETVQEQAEPDLEPGIEPEPVVEPETETED